MSSPRLLGSRAEEMIVLPCKEMRGGLSSIWSSDSAEAGCCGLLLVRFGNRPRLLDGAG